MTIDENEQFKGKGIVLFDGECSFCNNAVSFIIDRDPANFFRFATLKSDIGVHLRARLGIGDIDSIVLIENGRYFMKSSAVLRIARRLKSFWSYFYILIIAPNFIRNIAYDVFAKRRYSLFGKQETCLLLTPELRQKFLDL